MESNDNSYSDNSQSNKDINFEEQQEEKYSNNLSGKSPNSNPPSHQSQKNNNKSQKSNSNSNSRKTNINTNTNNLTPINNINNNYIIQNNIQTQLDLNSSENEGNADDQIEEENINMNMNPNIGLNYLENQGEEYNNDSHNSSDNEKAKETVKETPNKNQMYKDEISFTCLNVFLNFAKFYNEEKDFLLSFQTLVKLLVNIGILQGTSSGINSGNNTNSNNANTIIKNTGSGYMNNSLNKLNKLKFQLSNKPKKFCIKNCELDPLLKKISPKKVSKINSTQFLNLIVIIASKYSPKKFSLNPQETVYEFVSTYFIPLSKYISDSKNSEDYPYSQIENSINDLNKSVLDKKTLYLIGQVYKGLSYIYKVYFIYESKGNYIENLEKLIKESLGSLIKFCKCYEICPDLISVDKVAIYYNCLIDKEENEIFDNKMNLGHIFTLNKFCLFLINLANNSFNYISDLLWKRVLALLQKLDTCTNKKKDKIEFNNGKTKNCNNLLSIDEQIIKEINELDFEDNDGEGNINLNINSNEKEVKKFDNDNEDNNNELDSFDKNNQEGLNNNLNSHTNRRKKNKKINNTLLKIFEMYSVIGDKLNFGQMTLTSYLKFLKEFNIFDIEKEKPQNSKNNTINVNSNNNTIENLNNFSHPNSQNSQNLPLSPTNKTNLNLNYANSFKTTSNKLHKTKGYDSAHINQIEASLIFSEVCRTKKPINQHSNNVNYNNNYRSSNQNNFLSSRSKKINNRLNFSQFIEILHIISQRLHPSKPKNEAYTTFLLDDLKITSTELKYQSTQEIIDSINKIRSSQTKDVLYEFSDIVITLYQMYQNKEEKFNFLAFFQLYKDFGIFPNIVSLTESKKIYFSLANLYIQQFASEKKSDDFISGLSSIGNNDGGNNQNSSNNYLGNIGNMGKIFESGEENIDEEYLLWSFGISSLFIKNKNDVSDCEKMIILFEKMAKSNGVNNPRKLISGRNLGTIGNAFNRLIEDVKEKYGISQKNNNNNEELLKAGNNNNIFNNLFQGDNDEEDEEDN